MENIQVIELSFGYRVRWNENNHVFIYTQYTNSSMFEEDLVHRVHRDKKNYSQAVFKDREMIELYFPGLMPILISLLDEFQTPKHEIVRTRKEHQAAKEILEDILRKKRKAEMALEREKKKESNGNVKRKTEIVKNYEEKEGLAQVEIEKKEKYIHKLEKDLRKEGIKEENPTFHREQIITPTVPLIYKEMSIPLRVEFAFSKDDATTVRCERCEAICIEPQQRIEHPHKLLCPLCYQKEIKRKSRRK